MIEGTLVFVCCSLPVGLSAQSVTAELKPFDLLEFLMSASNVGPVAKCVVQNLPNGKLVGAASVTPCSALPMGVPWS